MITRFAPSLTGYLHLGHVLHMLYVWGIARARGGTVICRIEDHDLSRRRPEYEEAILEDMQWLGFLPDEGLSVGGSDSVPVPGKRRGRPSMFSVPSDYRQSDCGETYEKMLGRLEMQGLVYGCECSRKEILEGQDEAAGELCYSGTCSGKGLPLEGNTVRFRVPDEVVQFVDQRLGEKRQVPKQQCGDFSLRDRQGQWTYQFACVCDDIRHGVDCVIRGEDILASTARQILLFRSFDAPVPAYFHHPLIYDQSGDKLSKRQRSESISRFREAGTAPEEIMGCAMHAAGLIPDKRPVDVGQALLLITQ